MGNKKFGHLMIDLETLDTKRTAVILAIAAVEFNLETGEIGRTFYKKIDVGSSWEYGRTIDVNTLKWWLDQPKEALLEQLKDSELYLDVLTALTALTAFIKQFHSDTQIWANGISFDLEILKSAIQFICKEPWKFWQERDVRTLASLNHSIKENMVFKGTAHNALNDCFHQIAYCAKIYQSFNVTNPV
jgi:exodeoxyribonuclease VIII